MKSQKGKSQSLTDGRRCIWMKAGVINYKLCPYNYACHICPFDKGIRDGNERKPEQYRKITWVKKLRELAGPERYCRHMLQGLVSYKICSHNYECESCAFDQMIDDRVGLAQAPEVQRIAGFKIVPNYHFHRKHSWVSVEYGGKCRVGFDDFAIQVLGPDYAFTPPKIGQEVKQNEPFMKVRAAGREFELEAPVDGVVSVVNPLHRLSRELDPYAEGWVAFIEPSRRILPNLKKLLYGDKAMEWLNESSDKLFEQISPGDKITAADGGLLLPEIFGALPAEKRAHLIETVVLGE
jgi:glycine cleavage system H lipoate-binding protein